MFKQLLEIIKKHPTREKILLQKNSSVGGLIVDRICKESGGVVNFKSMSANSLALKYAGYEMARKSLKLIPEGGGDLVIQTILPKKGYYQYDEAMPGLPGVIWESLVELRLAGISPDQIRKLKLVTADKPAALADLLEKAAGAMQSASLIDWAGVFELAIKSIANQETDCLLIIPANISLVGMEKKFIESLKCEKITLAFNASDDQLIPEAWLDKRMKPQHVIAISDSKVSSLKKQVSAFLSPYFDAEVIEIIRRIKAARTQWEDIEIALCNTSAHASMVFSLLDTYNLEWAAAFPRPVTDFRIGRAASSLSSWIAGDFSAKNLLAMLEANEIRIFPPQKGKNLKEEIPGMLKVATLIRDSHAIGGRNGYNQPLEELRKIRHERERDIDEKQIIELKKRLKKLFDFIPEEGSPGAFAAGFARLFKIVALPSGKEEQIIQDQNLIKRITALCDSLAELKEPVVSRTAAMQWLNKLLTGLKTGEHRSRAGKILITGPGSHGLSGRRHLYFAGLNHSAVSGSSAADPILNEEVCAELKTQIGNALPSGEDKRLERLATLHTAFASLPEDAVVCISASEYELDKRAASMTPEFVKIVKRISGQGAVRFDDLRGKPDILPICSYNTNCQEKAIEGSDLLRIHGNSSISDKKQILSGISPAFSRFEMMQKLRMNQKTLVETGLPDWDPEKYDFRKNGAPVSASFISSLTGCNYYHFLNYVLRCMPYDQMTWEETPTHRWLDHMQRGNLLHEIFEIFLKKSGWPVNDSHSDLLEEVVEETINKFRVLIPPPDIALFSQEAKKIREDARCFFELEKQQAESGYEPIAFEIAFGMQGGGDADDKINEAAREPVTIKFPDGSSLNLRGKIDRIDKGPNGLRIVDYKTGWSDSYNDNPDKLDAAELQMAVYIQAGDELARRKVIPDQIVEACLYFPTTKGDGKRIEFSKEAMMEVIRPEEQLELFNIFRDGTFPAYVSDNCNFCNAWGICPFREIAIIPESEENEAAEKNEED